MPTEPGQPELPAMQSQLRQTAYATMAEQAVEHRQTLLRLAAEGARIAAALGDLASPAADALALEEQRRSEACVELAVDANEAARALNRGESPANPPGL